MNSAADAVIFDLEDGVIPSAKGAAREHVTEFLEAGGAGWVRINNVTTADWSIDLAALGNIAGLSGVMLAKTESAEQVDRTAAELPGIPVLALVESARTPWPMRAAVSSSPAELPTSRGRSMDHASPARRNCRRSWR
jgi:citrate lyase subunit beta/citryl-CoA lyase